MRGVTERAVCALSTWNGVRRTRYSVFSIQRALSLPIQRNDRIALRTICQGEYCQLETVTRCPSPSADLRATHNDTGAADDFIEHALGQRLSINFTGRRNT